MTALPIVDYLLYVSETLVSPEDDAWVYQPHLRCLRITEGVAPTVERANLIWQFGTMRRTHTFQEDVDAAEAYVDQENLRGKYVHIVVTSKGIDWYGYIRDDAQINWFEEEYDDDAFRVYGGEQIFVAYDLKYFLDRTIIRGQSTRQEDLNTRPFDYNGGAGDGSSVDTESKANRKPPADVMVDPFLPLEFSFDDDAIEWNAAAVVKHLLTEQCPRDHEDNPAPVEFVLNDDAIPYLDWYNPTVKTEGRTLLQVLDDVIDRRRGLVWWMSPLDVFGEDLKMQIHVGGNSPNSVTLPHSKTLPPAAVQVAIEDPNGLNLSGPPEFKSDGAKRWHRVRVRGARRTTTFSAVGSSAVGGLYGYDFAIPVDSRINKTWSVEDEEAYWQGVRPTLEPGDQTLYDALSDEEKSDRNDRFRQKKRFEKVYKYFSVEANSSSGMELSPSIDQATGDVVGNIDMGRRVMRLLPHTKMLVSYRYENAEDPEEGGDPLYGKEFVKPFALIHLRSGAQYTATTLGEVVDGGEEDDSTTDGNWRFMGQLNSNVEQGWDNENSGSEFSYERRFKHNFGLRILTAEPGFIVDCHGGAAHALCSPNEAGIHEGEAISRYPRELAWQCMLVTVATEWRAYCEAVWPVDVPEESPIEEQLIVIDDRARYDYLAKGTVYDIDAKGNLLQVQQGGAVRDDRDLCETIARIAYLWYGMERMEATFNFATVDRPWGLGDLLTTYGNGDAQKTLNAVVTQMTHNLEGGGTTISCNYPEVDFTTFA